MVLLSPAIQIMRSVVAFNVLLSKAKDPIIFHMICSIESPNLGVAYRAHRSSPIRPSPIMPEPRAHSALQG